MTNPIINEWTQRIQEAHNTKSPLQLQGSGSKAFYGHPTSGEIFDLTSNTGIIDYEPSELVITVNGGTSLAELESVLAEKNQFLAFEPPHFGDSATVAGCIAAGLAGPRRATAGGVQDFVLGAHMLDGQGQYLRFGGQVMKNVAGYDVSRLLSGSLGSLGVITQLSIKVLPVPVKEVTLALELDQQEALETINDLCSKPLPISASTWVDGTLFIRLSGAQSAIEAAIRTIQGKLLSDEDAASLWHQTKEQTHPFFARQEQKTLWRLSLPSTSSIVLADHDQLIEWGGALRWLHSDLTESEIRNAATSVGGTATAFRYSTSGSIFHPLNPTLLTIQQRLKTKFDPAGIFNPGRFYQEEL